jgi:hypothetical protein
VPLALPALALTLGVVVLWFVLDGMHQGSNTWLRTLLEEYTKPRGSFVKRAVTAPLRAVARGVLRVEQVVRAAIASALLASGAAVASWLHGLGVLALGIAHEIEELGKGIEAGIVGLTTVWIPRYVRRALAPVERLARSGYRLGLRTRAELRADARRLGRGIDRLRERYDHLAKVRVKGIEEGIRTNIRPRLKAQERATARTRTRDIPALDARVTELDRLLRGGVSLRLSRLEKLLGIGALTGAVVRVLAKRFPWLFCRNVGKLGRAVCGLNANTLNALTAILFGVLLVKDYQGLVREMQDVEHEAAQEVIDLLRAFD